MALTVPGLVNGSANLCFLNAIVQALASLSVYLDFLRSVLAAASDTTTPPEVVQALERTLTALQPQSRQQTFRPTMLVTALERSAVDTRSLLSPAAARQDHQDSHELLLKLLEAVDLEGIRLRGHCTRPSLTRVFASPLDARPAGDILRSPFTLLMASRVACTVCQECSGIHHAACSDVSLPVPATAATDLGALLSQTVHFEIIADYRCRRCSLLLARSRLANQKERARLKRAPDKTRRLDQELARLEAALNDRRLPAPAAESLTWLPSPTSRHTQIARAPEILTLHLSRATFSAFATKNRAPVAFPQTLVLDPFCSSAVLTVRAEQPLSLPVGSPTSARPRYIYRLASAVAHLGSEAGLGHYVAYRSVESGWLRISDDLVASTDIGSMRDSDVTLLFYQRVI